jgi:hypothetical protein
MQHRERGWDDHEECDWIWEVALAKELDVSESALGAFHLRRCAAGALII